MVKEFWQNTISQMVQMFHGTMKCRDMAIFHFSRWRPSAILNFLNIQLTIPCQISCWLVKLLPRHVNIIWLAACEGKCTVLIAHDISAAFDAIDHSILCQWPESMFWLNGISIYVFGQIIPVWSVPLWLSATTDRILFAVFLEYHRAQRKACCSPCCMLC